MSVPCLEVERKELTPKDSQVFMVVMRGLFHASSKVLRALSMPIAWRGLALSFHHALDLLCGDADGAV